MSRSEYIRKNGNPKSPAHYRRLLKIAYQSYVHYGVHQLAPLKFRAWIRRDVPYTGLETL